MNRWNRTIAVAALLSAFSAPALATDPSQTCTVCNDPTWLVASNRSPGVGVSVRAGTTGSVYSDPTWPTNAVATDGMAPSVPVAAPKAAAPAVHVAAR